MPRIKTAAPAKLNLHLRVGDRRPDGFHDIESLFLALDFGDTVLVETVAGDATEVRMDWRLPEGAGLPPEKNIVTRAVSLFRGRTGYGGGLRVTVEKRIPLGGGLGGGSSDAAATLLALNRLARPGGLLDPGILAEMGAELGSDVPFFVGVVAAGLAAAWVSGRGDLVSPVALPGGFRDLSLLLVCPGFHSDTAAAFRALDGHRLATPPGARTPGRGVSPDKIPGFLAGRPGDWPFSNDFLPVFAGRGEFYGDWLAYERIISCLKTLGADFAGLSGSGSTCFGVFSRKNMAKSAKKLLSKRWPYIFEAFACTGDDVVLE
ncbi:MAG: 4-(cytidine 5'-diphospho)-2-C-methyl-D-erythritol kinase [Treponema sp.]|nr:4-(cytidine 5'-diphospho)-2-C-methyl-D-erythritol kinase [Treponema sp.]